jgi:hypothetical protein
MPARRAAMNWLWEETRTECTNGRSSGQELARVYMRLEFWKAHTGDQCAVVSLEIYPCRIYVRI